MDRELTRDHYDATFGRCEGFPHTQAAITRDTGIDARIDGVRSYTVQTFRAPEGGGDFHFIEIAGSEGLTRVCLPPKVVTMLARQRESLSAMAKRANGRELAKRAPRPQKGVIPPQFRRRKAKG